MRKPSQMEAFDALYAIAAGGDREAALFGSSIELARPAFERMLVGDGYPDVYLEFPLLGNPCFDLLSVYGSIEPGVRFAAGAGFGRQDLFDWFAGACAADGVSCGLELDISAGETERAGVYLQQRMHTELVKPFLASIGEAARVQSYLDVLARMPRGWQPAYVAYSQDVTAHRCALAATWHCPTRGAAQPTLVTRLRRHLGSATSTCRHTACLLHIA